MTTENGSNESIQEPTEGLLDAPSYIVQDIYAELPDLRPALERIVDLLPAFVGYAHGTTDASPTALNTVVTQATNDLINLLYDIAHGRGRPAIMSARSLFDLVVSAKDLKGSAALEERYLAHGAVIRQVEAELRIETDELRGNERRKDVRRREKLDRATKKESNDAIKKYGSSFARTWAPDNLRTRAERNGMGKDYDFFRVASAVLHGSAGGSLGLIEKIEGKHVHRQGPALYLCPLAYLEGLRLYAELIRTLGRDFVGPSFDELGEALSSAKALYPKYRRAILKLDKALWPSTPPPAGVVAILAYLPLTNVERWYLQDFSTGLICEADPPAVIPEHQREAIAAAKKTAIREVPTSTDWASIMVLGVTISPKRGARWEHPARVLVQTWGLPSFPGYPRDVEIDERGELRPKAPPE